MKTLLKIVIALLLFFCFCWFCSVDLGVRSIDKRMSSLESNIGDLKTNLTNFIEKERPFWEKW